MSSIKDFLSENNLSSYFDTFMTNGYDDLNQLLRMGKEDLEEVCKDLGFHHIIGHRKRFIAAVLIKASIATDETISVENNTDKNRGMTGCMH